MDWFLLATWGSVVFGALTMILIGLWFIGGRKSAPLRIGGAVSILISTGCFAYTNYLA
ncbi:hypothetical protein [Tabrizicola sp.]|uniref:hypothetical protein n=1 Tax=Tabrizicola sp. TaxID=2005166 RepID=UPI003F3A3A5E